MAQDDPWSEFTPSAPKSDEWEEFNPKKPKNAGTSWGDYLSLPIGVAKGLIDTASASGQAAQIEMGQPVTVPDAEEAQKVAEENITGPMPEPTHWLGKYGSTIGQFAGNPATWLAPGTLAGKAGLAAASAIGSETAGQLVPDSTAARVVGSLVPGTVLAAGRGIYRSIEPKGTAAKQLGLSAARDEETPKEWLRELRKVREYRPDAMLADVVGENTRGLIERVANTPGAGLSLVKPTLSDRQAAQRLRINKDLAELTGSEAKAHEYLAETIANQKMVARPAYKEAMNFNAREVPEIMRAWDQVTSTGWGQSILKSGKFRKNLQSEYGISNPQDAPMMVLIDAWKKQADQLERVALKSARGNDARIIRGEIKKIVPVVDEFNPAYKRARHLWETEEHFKDAIEDGQQILKRPADETVALLADMEDYQKKGYRIGANTAIRQKMGNDPAKMADMTKYLRSEEMRRKIAAMMPTPEKAGDWERRLQYEIGSSELTGMALGNSRTAIRQAMQEDARNIVSDLVMDTLTPGATGWKVLSKAATWAPKAVRDTWRSRSDRMLAETLLKPSPELKPGSRLTSQAEIRRRLEALQGARQQRGLLPLATPAITSSETEEYPRYAIGGVAKRLQDGGDDGEGDPGDEPGAGPGNDPANDPNNEPADVTLDPIDVNAPVGVEGSTSTPGESSGPSAGAGGEPSIDPTAGFNEGLPSDLATNAGAINPDSLPSPLEDYPGFPSGVPLFPHKGEVIPGSTTGDYFTNVDPLSFAARSGAGNAFDPIYYGQPDALTGVLPGVAPNSIANTATPLSTDVASLYGPIDFSLAQNALTFNQMTNNNTAFNPATYYGNMLGADLIHDPSEIVPHDLGPPSGSLIEPGIGPQVYGPNEFNPIDASAPTLGYGPLDMAPLAGPAAGFTIAGGVPTYSPDYQGGGFGGDTPVQTYPPNYQGGPIQMSLGGIPHYVSGGSVKPQREAREPAERLGPHQKINRSYDVPYLAGASNDGRTVFIDRRLPARINVRLASGKGHRAIDPAIPLGIHERTERIAMERMLRQGMSEKDAYAKAHSKVATPAERKWLDDRGLDWKHYEEILDGYIDETEHENPQHPPSGLYLKPYPCRIQKELKSREGKDGKR